VRGVRRLSWGHHCVRGSRPVQSSVRPKVQIEPGGC
jgi:hypothetical protein